MKTLPAVSRLFNRRVWVFIIPGFLLLIHAAIFARFTIDDAYITFTYAKNLAHGNGFVFAPGNDVEATSSALWAFLLSFFELATKNGAITGSKILGGIFLLGTQVITIALAENLSAKGSSRTFTSLAAGLMVSGTSAFVVWGMYGMENSLTAFLLTASVWMFIKEYQNGAGYLSAIPIFLLEAVRPEGFIYIFIFIAFRVVLFFQIQGKSHKGQKYRWFFILITCLIAYEGFGMYYFGHLMPNTVQAKVTLTLMERITSGILYLASPFTFIHTLVFIFAGVLFLKVKPGEKGILSLFLRADPAKALIFYILAAQFSFAIYTGGDWMINARFLSHTAPLLIILFGTGFSNPSKISANPRSGIIFSFLLIAYLSVNGVISTFSYRLQQELEISEERALRGMALLINEINDSPDITVAGSDVGRLSYYLNGSVIDWWGLADDEIASTGQSLGNIKAETILQRQPDFIILYSNQPVLEEGSMEKNMAVYSKPFFEDPGFNQNYEQVAALLFWDERWHILFQRQTPKANR